LQNISPGLQAGEHQGLRWEEISEHIFSRDFLLERLWDPDFDGLDRAVDTQMVRLRRKLGDLGVCIETVWGAGYRFRPELLTTT